MHDDFMSVSVSNYKFKIIAHNIYYTNKRSFHVMHPNLDRCFGTYLRSPSTSGRSFVMAMTNANMVTKVVMKATGELQVKLGCGIRY